MKFSLFLFFFFLNSCAHWLQSDDLNERAQEMRISPYFIRTPNQHLLMKFSLAKNQNFPLVMVNGLNKDYPQRTIFDIGRGGELAVGPIKEEYSENRLIEVDIGLLECDQKVAVELKWDRETTTASTIKSSVKSLVESYQIPPYACDGNEEISFLYVGDTHSNAAFFKREMALIRERHPHKKFFSIIHAGDFVTEGVDLKSWNRMAQALGFANAMGGNAIPIISAIGNHEYHGYPSGQRVPHQNSGKSTATPWIFKKYFFSDDDNYGYDPIGFYSLHYPQLVLIVINSNFIRLCESDREQQWSFIGREVENADLAKLPVVVIAHHALFSSNIFRINKVEGVLLREKLLPMLEGRRLERRLEAKWPVEKNLPMTAVLSAHVHLNEQSEKAGISYLNAGVFGGWPMISLWGNRYKKFSNSFSTTYSIITVSKRGVAIESY